MYSHTSFHCAKTLLIVCALIFFSIENSNGQNRRHLYVRSASAMETLENFEFRVAQRILQSLRESDILSKRPEIRQMAELYLQDFNDGNALENITDAFVKREGQASRNPICALTFLRRMAVLLQRIVSHQHFSELFGELGSDIHSFSSKNSWPNLHDVEDTITVILTLQHIYNLNIPQLANGLVHTIQTNCTLNSVHCYDISRAALKMGHYASAIEWMELAKEKSLVDKLLDVLLIENSLRIAIVKHNHALEDSKDWEADVFERKITHEPQDSKRAKKRRDTSQFYDEFKGNRHMKFVDTNFRGLCAGNNIQGCKKRPKLFCWYEYKIHPSFTMGPVKMEFLSRNPDVVQMYEVIYESEIQSIISKGKTRMKTMSDSESGIGDDKPPEATECKTSLDAWYDETNSTAIPRKIERLTGLYVAKTPAAEPLQVAAYPFWGDYLPHVDTFSHVPEESDGCEDRIATFKIYLNNVELGGSTVFPLAGASASPIKGSAFFWFNLFSDGEKDIGTFQGECPVLLGEKWAGTKGILARDQFLVRKCGLKRKERLKIPVNGVYLPSSDKSDGTYRKPSLIPEETIPGSSLLLHEYSFMSPEGLKALAKLEWDIYRNLKLIPQKFRNPSNGQSTQEIQKFIREVDTYLMYFERTTLKINGLKELEPQTTEWVEKIAWNPLASYHTVVRFLDIIQVWMKDESALRGNPVKAGVVFHLNIVYNITDGPTNEDLSSAMFAIINIHYIYGLSAEDIAAGYLDGVNTGVTLKANDCLRIGKHSLSLQYFTIGIEWLEHALYLLENTLDDTVDYDSAVQDLEAAELLHDVEYENSKGYEPYFFYEPLKDVPAPEWRVTRKSLQYDEFKLKKEANYVPMNFWGVCEGKSHQTPKEKSKLFCWYEHAIHPSFRINPIKVEIHSLHPDVEVVQFYDIISERAIDSLRRFTSGNYARAGGSDDIHVGLLPYDPRKRQAIQAWVSDEDSEESLKVSKLVERITGLKVVGGREGLQLAAYTTGSYYTVHHDSGSFDEEGSQARIATFMFYFSDVEKGGSTAFAQAGVNVEPKKGSAVFWYNLLPSGMLNHFAWHGACPVVFGEKWVANKWIGYEAQRHLQCDKTSETAFEILVNGKSKYA